MQLEITLSKKKFSKTLLLQNDPLTKYQMFWMKFLIIQFDAPTAYWFTSSPATGRARRSAPHVLVYTNIYDMFRHWPYNYVTLPLICSGAGRWARQNGQVAWLLLGLEQAVNSICTMTSAAI